MKISKICVFIIILMTLTSVYCDAEESRVSFDGNYMYNKTISKKYKTDVYGEPYGQFLIRDDGLCQKDGNNGEYMYLGYNYYEREITNDRYFRDVSMEGNNFEDYEGVEWTDLSPEAQESWRDLEGDSVMIDFLLYTNFHDADHTTAGITDTGYCLWDLLGSEYKNKSIVLTTPDRGSNGTVYLKYGENYNTVLIKPSAGIIFTITCEPDIYAISENETRDVNITIDASESYWTSAGIEYSDFTTYRYWAGTGTIVDSEIQERNESIYTYRVKNVSPNTTINIWCEAISEELEFFDFEYRKEATDSIFIGEKPNTANTSEYDLDYHILSREIRRKLPKNTATLTKSSGDWWSGSATGSLGVANDTPNLLHSFYVTDNPEISSHNTKFTRTPVIHSIIHRKSLGDDPQNHIYKQNTVRLATGEVSYSGSVKRRYGYNYTRWNCECAEDEDGNKYCGGHTGYSTATAYFDSGQDNLKIKTNIYNGKVTIPQKSFDDRIEYNYPNYLKKNLYWTSEEYEFDAIRWMYHMDENDNLYDATKIDGQYPRTFRQQCSAEVQWDVVNRMVDDYEGSREAARYQDYRREEYDKAVFASDRDLRNIDYPIKSGYYFNPTGEYTFTVETETYKQTEDDTEDHRELVDAVIKAFRYESDLMYINNGKEAVNIRNEWLPTSGNSYGKRSSSLTVEQPTGVNDMVLLEVIDRINEESRYEKTVEEILHSEDIGGYTDAVFKEILEGYGESGTGSSKALYKYREYIKNGQKMYKITERTMVTIKINPDNKPVYTHAHMPDGEYTVRAWVDNIDLSSMDNEHAKLNTLCGIQCLDDIEITVKGSMYDDVY